jgi:hypothetical protein
MTLHFLARVFDDPALAPIVGSLVDPLPGDWVKIGTARIGMPPSQPGMGEMKLSNPCI